MSNQYEFQLREQGQFFVELLRRNRFDAEILEGSLRDYSIKISIAFEGRSLGKAVIYYSPKKKSFKMELGELADKSYVELLQDLWHGDSEATGLCLYIDGSFIVGSNCVGWSVVIVKDNNLVGTLSGSLSDVSMNQVLGELEAAKQSVLWCKNNGICSMTVAYDYQGVCSWATGNWDANEPATVEYVEFMKVHLKELSITWLKIDAHSGNRWNEQADQLAKQACQ